VYGRLSGPAHRLDMSFTAADSDTAALAMPHGLIGQSVSAPARREGKVAAVTGDGRADPASRILS
jgi:hypothetical protein